MNILQQQNALKHFSDEQLVKEMKSPSGSSPQFLIMTELSRRNRAKKEYEAALGDQPMQTTAEQIVGERLGLGSIAPQGAPQQSSMRMSDPTKSAPMNTPTSQLVGGAAQQPIGMQSGGLVGEWLMQHPDDALKYSPDDTRMQRFGKGLGQGIQWLADWPRTGYDWVADKAQDIYKWGVEEQPYRPTIEPEPQQTSVISESPAPQKEPAKRQDRVEPYTEYKPNVNAKADRTDYVAPADVTQPTQQPGILNKLAENIDKAQTRADKERAFNKWLAVAKMGFAMASSTRSDFLGAVGEGGVVGAAALSDASKAYTEAMDSLMKRELDLAGLQESARSHDMQYKASIHASNQRAGRGEHSSALVGHLLRQMPSSEDIVKGVEELMNPDDPLKLMNDSRYQEIDALKKAGKIKEAQDRAREIVINSYGEAMQHGPASAFLGLGGIKQGPIKAY